MPKQFTLPFANSRVWDSGNFIVAPCNRQALDFIARWPDWPARSAALFGPAGCGKSHLASIWRNRAGADAISARELAADSARNLRSCNALVVEDVDGVPPDASRDRALMELYDNPDMSLLLTGRLPPSQWPAGTGDWKSRLQSLIAFELWSPDDEFLLALMARHFAERQLQAPASVLNRILAHVERTPDAVARFIESADQKALSEKRPVSLRLVTEMLDDNGEADTSAAYLPVTPAGLAP